MVEIKIDNTGNGTFWLYGKSEEWKIYVVENFDEKVVLTGNRHFTGCTEAEWYNETKSIINDFDFYDELPDELTEEQKEKIRKLYDECKCTEEIFIDVLKILYPNKTFKTGTIRGYNQGDWQNYIAEDEIDIETLENFYFGKIADIYVEMEDEETFSDVITHDELWKAKYDGNIKEYFRERFDIPKEEEIHILMADGYVQVADWKEVC